MDLPKPMDIDTESPKFPLDMAKFLSKQELEVLCDNLGEDIDGLHSDEWMRVSTAM